MGGANFFLGKSTKFEKVLKISKRVVRDSSDRIR